MYDCPCTQWSVRAGDVSWKNPRKKEGTKSRKWLLKTRMLRVQGTQRSTLWPREVFWPLYYEKEKVPSSERRRWGLEYTQTESSSLPLGREEAGEKNMKPSRFFMSQRKYMCEYGAYGEMQKLRTSAVKSFRRSKKACFSLIGGTRFFYPRNLKSCGSLVCCHSNFKRLLSSLFQFPAYSISLC